MLSVKSGVDHAMLHLLSVPLLAVGDGRGPPERIGAVSMSVALLEPHLTARRARASLTHAPARWGFCALIWAG